MSELHSAVDGWGQPLLDNVVLSGAPTKLGVLSGSLAAVRLLSSDQQPRVWTRTIGGVLLATVQSGGHMIEAAEPVRRTLFFPVRGHFRNLTEHGQFTADAGGAVLVPPGDRQSWATASPDGDFLGVAIAIPMPQECVGGRACGRIIDAVRADPAGAAVADYLAFLVRQHSRPGTPLHHPMATRAAEALLHDLVAALDLGGAPAEASEKRLGEDRVVEAEALMWAQSDEPLTVEEVARSVGVGTRTLQLAFRAHRGVLPRAVLTAFRLERARARLLVPDPLATVTSVALMSGFAHFGRFAAAYRARFGETPSDTLRGSRRGMPVCGVSFPNSSRPAARR